MAEGFEGLFGAPASQALIALEGDSEVAGEGNKATLDREVLGLEVGIAKPKVDHGGDGL